MADVFISYAREDSAFVRSLFDEMVARDRNLWVDWEDIPLTADWWQEIKQGIESANSFLFVVTPASMASPVCQLELDHAAACNKRLIPVMLHEPDTDSTWQRLQERAADASLQTMLAGRNISQIAEANQQYISRHNWVFYQTDTPIDNFVDTLLTVVDMDLDHVRQHTRLLVRALEWEDFGRRRSRLLTGDDIQQAETWLAQAVDKEPPPTSRHATYIDASRKAATAQQRQLITGVSVALVITAVLAVAALFFAQDARQQSVIAGDNEQTAIAERDRADRNLQTAVAAQQTAEAEEIRANNSAETAIAERNRADEQANLALAQQYAAQSRLALVDNPAAGLWQALEAVNIARNTQTTGTLLTAIQQTTDIIRFLSGHIVDIRAVAYSPGGQYVATADEDGHVLIHEAATGRIQAELDLYYTVVDMQFADDDTLLTQRNGGRVTRWLWQTGTSETLIAESDNLQQYVATGGILTESSVAYRLVTDIVTNNDKLIIEALNTDERLEFPLSEMGAVVTDVSLSPGASWLGLIFGNGSSAFLSVNTEATVQFSDGYATPAIAWSADDRYVAYGFRGSDRDDDTILMRVYDLQNDVLVGEWGTGVIGTEPITALAFTRDADALVIGTDGGYLLTLDPQTGAVRRDPVRVLESSITALAISPDEQALVAGDRNGDALIVSMQPNVVGQSVGLPAFDGTQALSIADNRIHIGYDGGYFLLDATTREMLLDDSQPGARASAVSPDGTRLVVQSVESPGLSVWDVTGDAPQRLHTYDLSSDAGLPLAVTSTHILVRVDTDTLHVYDLHRPQQTDTVTLPILFSSYTAGVEGIPNPLAVSSDGASVAAGIGFDGLVVYDVGADGRLTNEQIYTLDAPDDAPDTFLMSLAINDRHVAGGYIDGDVVIYNRETDEVFQTSEHGSSVMAVALSPDASMVASVSEDRILRLWQMGSPVTATVRLGDPIRLADRTFRIQFSATGEELLILPDTMDALRVIPASLAGWQTIACNRLNGNLSEDAWSQLFPSRPYTTLCPEPLNVSYPRYALEQPDPAEAVNAVETATPEAAISPEELQNRLETDEIPFTPLFNMDVLNVFDGWYVQQAGVIDLVANSFYDDALEMGTSVDELAFGILLLSTDNPDLTVRIFQSAGDYPDAETWLRNTIHEAALPLTRVINYKGTDIITYSAFGQSYVFFIYDDVHVNIGLSGAGQDVALSLGQALLDVAEAGTSDG